LFTPSLCRPEARLRALILEVCMDDLILALGEYRDASTRRAACARRLRLAFDAACAAGELLPDEVTEVRSLIEYLSA